MNYAQSFYASFFFVDLMLPLLHLNIKIGFHYRQAVYVHYVLESIPELKHQIRPHAEEAEWNISILIDIDGQKMKRKEEKKKWEINWMIFTVQLMDP